MASNSTICRIMPPNRPPPSSPPPKPNGIIIPPMPPWWRTIDCPGPPPSAIICCRGLRFWPPWLLSPNMPPKPNGSINPVIIRSISCICRCICLGISLKAQLLILIWITEKHHMTGKRTNRTFSQGTNRAKRRQYDAHWSREEERNLSDIWRRIFAQTYPKKGSPKPKGSPPKNAILPIRGWSTDFSTEKQEARWKIELSRRTSTRGWAHNTSSPTRLQLWQTANIGVSMATGYAAAHF